MQRAQVGYQHSTRAALIRYVTALLVLAAITATSFLLVRTLITDIRQSEAVIAHAADLRSEIHKTMLALDAVEVNPSEANVAAARSHGESLRSGTDRLLLLLSPQADPAIWSIVKDPEHGLESSVRPLVEHATASGGAVQADLPESPAVEPEPSTHGAVVAAGENSSLYRPTKAPKLDTAGDGQADAMPAGHHPVAMKAVDDLIASLREDARRKQERAAFLHDALGYGTVLILLLEAAIVFRPLLKTARSQTERADQAVHELEYLAAHDALTGLLNRGQIDRVLQLAVSEAASVNQQLGLILLDLDEFKPINDRYGHAAGDKALQAVAASIQAAVRPGDICGRLGGDEFIVVLPNVEQETAIGAVARRILELLSTPVRFDGHDITVAASIGYAMFPIAGADVQALMSAADLAMYDAKNGGRGRVSEFSHRMRAEAERNRVAESDLRRAFSANEFEVHYQTIHGADGSAVAAEALVRWRHPRNGLLLPAEFLPDVRRTGRLGRLTRLVLEQAIGQFSAWRAAGLGLRSIHVNVEQDFLEDTQAHEQLTNLLKIFGISPPQVVLEITKDGRLDLPAASEGIARLRALGLELAIDDFGVGSTSLEHIGHPAIGIVKLDVQTVRAAAESGKGTVVLASLESMFTAMGKKIIAEGVENGSIQAMAVASGIQLFQGYHMCRPASAAEITARLAAVFHANEQPGQSAEVLAFNISA